MSMTSTTNPPAPARTPRAKTGRPRGSKTATYEQSLAEPSRCPKCQSTRRAPYHRSLVQHYPGKDSQGRPFTQIVRRWTHCLACGQHRIDRSYEFPK
jgi:hypothetical protein